MRVTEILAYAEPAAALSLPLYASRPAAGFPAPGDDMVEQALDLNELLIEHPVSTFFVRVEGDSMEGAQIFSGDLLVVNKAREARSGDIVVAAVYGELVVKRFVVRDGEASLLSENPAYQPIVVAEGGDVYLWGVVVGSVRRFV